MLEYLFTSAVIRPVNCASVHVTPPPAPHPPALKPKLVERRGAEIHAAFVVLEIRPREAVPSKAYPDVDERRRLSFVLAVRRRAESLSGRAGTGRRSAVEGVCA